MATKAEAQLYSRNQLVSTLLQIKHPEKNTKKGVRAIDNVTKLDLYIPDVLAAAKADADLLGRFIAWNSKFGTIRDSKVALPPIALRGLTKEHMDLAENAVAHMLLLTPRDLERSYNFSVRLSKLGHKLHGGIRSSRILETGLKLYLQRREENPTWWKASVLQHRNPMKSLYRLAHLKPADYAQAILFDQNYPPNSVFEKIAKLRNMPMSEAVEVILSEKVPFEVAVATVPNPKDKNFILTLLGGMTGNQVITNTNMLTRLGVMRDEVLKVAYDAALARARTDKRVETLKAGVAASKATGEVKAQLEQFQEDKLTQLGSIEGDWLILGDRSLSMATSIEVARQVSSLIAQRVSGSVYLVFFNTDPTFYNVTGKTYEQILEETRRVAANGSTSIGCGLDYIRSKGIIVNGIAIASDGGENRTPAFTETYTKYCTEFGIEPPVYLFHVPGDPNVLSDNLARGKVQVEQFELGRNVDYYSLPNIVTTLRANRYQLFQEVMETNLLTFVDIFKQGALA